MNALSAAILFCVFVQTALAGGHDFDFNDDYGFGYGAGGVGIGSSVVLLRGGPGLHQAVEGPVFLLKAVHHVKKLHGKRAPLAQSGLGFGVGYGGYEYEGLAFDGGFGCGVGYGFGYGAKD